jgi:hypothetical protein
MTHQHWWLRRHPSVEKPVMGLQPSALWLICLKSFFERISNFIRLFDVIVPVIAKQVKPSLIPTHAGNGEKGYNQLSMIPTLARQRRGQRRSRDHD